MANLNYQKESSSCLKCSKKLTFFIAYIPSIGDACMDCYIEAAKIDEANVPP